ncbi:MAG: DUF2971 domain-containing protein [bacterium]
MKAEFKRKHRFPQENGINRLYKFYRFTQDTEQWAQEILTYGHLYHSEPSSFNDPWEGFPRFRSPSTPGELAQFRRKLTAEFKKSYSGDMNRISKEVTNIMANRSELNAKVQDAVRSTFSTLQLCSLSSSLSNPLLWSHYSDSHRGFCVEFDTNLYPVASAMKVHYQDDLAEVTFPLEKESALSVVLTKASFWSYEAEYRLLRLPEEIEGQSRLPIVYNGNSAVLPASSITSIYLGAMADSGEKNRIINLVKGGRFSPAVYETTLSLNKFGLDFNRISI